MRNIATILVVAAAAGILTLPLAYGADQSDSSTSSQGHVQQHQEAVPSQNSDSRRDQSAPDQSAQAPQSPSVITPPSTGDKSVITPPATGAANMPVIKPPGTSGNKDEIQPK